MSRLQATIEISKAVHARLSADVLVQGQLGNPPRLYDSSPEDPVFPYLTYGPMRSEDISADGAIIQSHTMTLHIWSRYAGRAEVMEVLSAVTTALEDAPLNLTGIALARAQVTYTDIFRAPDGQTLHGLIRYALTTDEEEAA